MTTTVKVFIILNLILALAFTWITMTLFATRENWKRRWSEDTSVLSADINRFRSKLTDETYAKVAAQHQVRELETQISDHQAKIKEQAATIAQKDEQIAARDLQISKQQADIAGLQEDNRTLTTTNEMLRGRNSELNHIAQVARAVAFQLNVKLAEVEDDYNNATTELAKRDEEITSMTKDWNADKAKLSIVRDRHGAIWKELTDETVSHKFLQGVVAAVKKNPQGQQDLVMVTIGNEEGVEEGMEFIVFRANHYIVKVRVERVIKDMAACRVIPDSWNTKGIEVQQGDMAQNKL